MGVKIGGSKLLGEVPKDFSNIVNEFDNKTGLSTSFEISRYVLNHWEIGAEAVYSTLHGSTNSPEFSAEGIQAGIPPEINDPVEYQNKLTGAKLFFRYFFKPTASESLFNPFVGAGGGILSYNSKFKYSNVPDDDLLFGKGLEGYTNLSTPV